MAIEIMQVPQGSVGETPGPLNLPVAFDRKKFAAKWVKEGPAVAAAAEREWIPGTKATADGWEVWRDDDGKPHKVALQSGVHVLLCRDKVVQDAFNAICGNVGKSRLSGERKGETVAGQAPTDSGMLSDERLNKVIGREETEEGDVAMNAIPETGSSQRVTAPTLKTKSTVTRRVVKRRNS